MPLPEQAPAARPISGKTVMSWHWLVRDVVCVPSPWLPPFHSPAIAGCWVGEDARTIDDLRVLRPASGTWMTSMLKSDVFGSSFGRGRTTREFFAERTVLVPVP